MVEPDGVFRALLRSWRNQRGMSQLDLGVTAEVSARHISFLETGRSRPSVEMVMLLAEVLDVPLRDRNEMLRAAGFVPHYDEPDVSELLAGPVGTAVSHILEHAEPFPLMLFDRAYDLITGNQAATRLFALVGFDLDNGPNLLRIAFDPVLREFMEDWESTAGTMLRRAQRELMHRPSDHQLAQLVADLVETPDIPDDWRTPDLTEASEPAVPLRLRLGPDSLSLLGTVTSFSAPSNVTLEELQIESWIPLDDGTRDWFEQLAIG